jgi:hypothetical protein
MINRMNETILCKSLIIRLSRFCQTDSMDRLLFSRIKYNIKVENEIDVTLQKLLHLLDKLLYFQ